MILRPYRDEDAGATLEVFFAAIRETASRDYGPEQIEAWCWPERSPDEWARQRAAARTVVATDGDGDEILGFTDLGETGLIDMMYVAPRAGRRGVGTFLLDDAVRRARRDRIPTLTTYASETARPFFAANGFRVIAERRRVVRSVAMANFDMERILRGR